jgi:mRNA-degrading endonuclease YafQ of YafQ-DinJ toxin-antitoxin module
MTCDHKNREVQPPSFMFYNQASLAKEQLKAESNSTQTRSVSRSRYNVDPKLLKKRSPVSTEEIQKIIEFYKSKASPFAASVNKHDLGSPSTDTGSPPVKLNLAPKIKKKSVKRVQKVNFSSDKRLV